MFAHPSSSYDYTCTPSSNNISSSYLLPPLAPLPQPPDGLLSRKRPADDGEAGASGSAPKRVAKTAEVVYRLLVAPAKIGKVIGKQGTNIKQLREETTARIKIPDPISTTEDRVILISSKEEALLSQTAAQTCLLRLATILMEEQEVTPNATVGPQHNLAQHMTRLLIAGSQAGGLIGKTGSVINSIRESSGATVRILPSDKLPPCSAASDTDRLVQISGEVSQICKALELVAAKLREFPPKDSVSTAPSLGVGINSSGKYSLSQAALASYPLQSTGNGYLDHLGIEALSSHGFMLGQIGSDLAVYGGALSTQPKVTSEMSVPSVFMGGIIGRGGANITHIRTVSGASIKVHGQKEDTTKRTIYFEGTPEQVAAAKNLIQDCLNSI